MSQQPAQTSFWRSLRMVGWGLLGIRKKGEYEKDMAQVNPFHVIAAGLIVVVLLVLALVGIVNWVAGGSA